MNYLNILDKQLYQLNWLIEKTDKLKVNFYYSVFYKDAENLFFNADILKETREKYKYDEVLVSNILTKIDNLFRIWENKILNKLEPTSTKTIYYFDVSNNDLKVIAKKVDIEFKNEVNYTFKEIQSIELHKLLYNIKEIKQLLYNGSLYAKKQKEKTEPHNSYLISFNQKHFKNVTTKINDNGTKNAMFFNTNNLLNYFDKELSETSSLKEYESELLNFNKRMFNVITNIIQVYKKVSLYEETKKDTYLTQRELEEIKLNASFKQIKDLYSNLIFEKVRHKKIEIASDIQDYCIFILNKTEYFLKNNYFIDIDKSPLNDGYKEISFELKQAIDIDKIKLLSELNKKEQVKKEKTILKSKYIQNLPIDRLPLNEHTIKYFGIDYDNLTNEQIQNELSLINDVFVDYENKLVYTGVFSYLEDETYYNILKELEIPMLEDLKKTLAPIKNPEIKNNLYPVGVCKILEAQYQAKSKVYEKLMSRIKSENQFTFDANHFNSKGFDLYNYLIENYTQIGKRKFINIYHFLKKHTNKNIYTFNFTEKKYKAYALTNHTIELKNMSTADYKFDNEKSTLNSLEEQFRKQ